MTTRSWRITVIGVDLPDDLGDHLQSYLEDLVVDAIVEVRRTVTSDARRGATREICE